MNKTIKILVIIILILAIILGAIFTYRFFTANRLKNAQPTQNLQFINNEPLNLTNTNQTNSEIPATNNQILSQPNINTAPIELPKQVEISINNFSFKPKQVNVPVGSTITWTNDDPPPHTITFDDFTSASLITGQSFTHTFNEPGIFNYHCALHPSMKAVIIVQ